MASFDSNNPAPLAGGLARASTQLGLWRSAVARRCRQGWRWLRFGTVTSKVVGTAGDNVPAEIAYYGRGLKMVGYWAYGSWDPAFPYKE